MICGVLRILIFMNNVLRVLYMSSGAYGAAVLEALAARGIQPVGVVTTPPAPKGRGRKPHPTPQAVWARQRGLPVWETRTPQEPPAME
ncbi:MAG: hypothetical protein L3J76_01065, partial [Candidatus Hydrothermae bacterium]|nr:hypothetical protein [Candidatus Hydrothermae bacterium]